MSPSLLLRYLVLTFLTGLPEFVIGSACALESGPDYLEATIEECGSCWPEDLLSENGLEAQFCAQTYTPNIYAACKSEIEGIGAAEDKDAAGQAVIQCFLSYIQENDFPADGAETGAAAVELGPIQEEVLAYLADNPLEDVTFLLGAACTTASAPDYNEEQIAACGRCFPAVKETAEGIDQVS